MAASMIEEAASQRSASRVRVARALISQFTLATADALSFLSADFLFRIGRQVPDLVLFAPQNSAYHQIHIDVFALLAVLFIGVRAVAGDYSRRELFWESTRSTTKAVLITAIPDLLLMTAGLSIYSPAAILLSWAFVLFAIPLYRQAARGLLLRAGLWAIPSALIGDVSRAAHVTSVINSSLSFGIQLRTTIPYCVAPAECDGEGTASSPADVGVRDAIRQVVQSGCEHAVLVVEDMNSDYAAALSRALLEADITLAVVPSLRRLPLSGLTINQFFGKDVLVLQVRDSSREWARAIGKRLFDIVGASALILLLSPVLSVIAFAVKRHDGGPIFYGHLRVGRGGVPFRCLKFRTMAVDADARLERWKEEHPELYQEFLKTYKLREDPRITGPGNWLRRTSLDELPQLFNVLRGEMSLVGPRPVVRKELDEYYGTAAQLYARVRPGMTGLWQVSGRSDTTYAERVTYDELYVLNWSFWYDIVILIQTAWIVGTGKGAF